MHDTKLSFKESKMLFIRNWLTLLSETAWKLYCCSYRTFIATNAGSAITNCISSIGKSTGNGKGNLVASSSTYSHSLKVPHFVQVETSFHSTVVGFFTCPPPRRKVNWPTQCKRHLWGWTFLNFFNTSVVHRCIGLSHWMPKKNNSWVVKVWLCNAICNLAEALTPPLNTKTSWNTMLFFRGIRSKK